MLPDLQAREDLRAGEGLRVAQEALSGRSDLGGLRGAVGATGPAGTASEDDVLNAIEDNPDEVAQAIQGSLDPDPADVESNVEDLCTSLQLTDALSNEILSCP